VSGIYLTERATITIGPEETHVILPQGLGEFTIPTTLAKDIVEDLVKQIAALDLRKPLD
jgi:hypothetical protein